MVKIEPLLKSVARKVVSNWRLCCCLALCHGSLWLVADDNEAKSLPELRVFSTRSEELLLEAPLAISLISREELEASPKRTLVELLRDVPGLTVETLSTPGMPRITIRGESANRVLILQDGQRLSEQKSMNGPPVLFSSAGVERIEVIRGPASVLYGSEAVGGVINIITQRRVDVPLTGTLEFSADSATHGWGSAISLDGFSEGWEYGLSGLRLEHGDRRTPAGTIKPTSYDLDDVAAYIGWRDQNLSIRMRYERFTSSVSSAPPPTLPSGLTSFYTDIPDWDRQKLSIHAELHELSEHLTRLALNLYVQESEKNFVQRIGASTPAGPFTMNVLIDNAVWNRLRSYGASVQTDWALPGGHYFIAGFDAMLDQLDDKERAQVSISGLPTGPSSSKTIHADDALQTELALFLRDEWTMGADWMLDLGLRHTWVYSRLDETTRAYPKKSQRDDAAVFSATLLNRSIDNLTLRLGFGQGYRFPSLLELYTGARHSDNGSDVLPNADLDAERTNSFELGARYENGRLSIDSAWFFSDARDYITMPRVDATTYQYANVDKSQAFGWEWQLVCVMNPEDALRLTPYLQGLFLRRSYENKQLRTYESGFPDWSGRLGLRLDSDEQGPFSWGVDFYARMASEADSLSLITGDLERYSGWTTYNLEASCRWLPRADKPRQIIRMGAGVENISDKRYSCAREWLYAPGRNYFIRLAMSF